MRLCWHFLTVYNVNVFTSQIVLGVEAETFFRQKVGSFPQLNWKFPFPNDGGGGGGGGGISARMWGSNTQPLNPEPCTLPLRDHSPFYLSNTSRQRSGRKQTIYFKPVCFSPIGCAHTNQRRRVALSSSHRTGQDTQQYMLTLQVWICFGFLTQTEKRQTQNNNQNL